MGTKNILIKLLFMSCLVISIEAKPRPSVCAETKIVVDSLGFYVKSICYIAASFNHEEAELICADNGMTLYKFDSEDAKKGFHDWANSKWGNKNAARLIYHGRNSVGCNVLSHATGSFEEVNEPCDTYRCHPACEFGL